MTTRERKSAVASERGRSKIAAEWIDRLTRARSEMLRTLDEREMSRHSALFQQLKSGTGFEGGIRWHHPPAVAHLLADWTGEGIDTWVERRDHSLTRAEALAVGLPTDAQVERARLQIAGIEEDLERLDAIAAERRAEFREALETALQLAHELAATRAEQDDLIDRGQRLGEQFDLPARRSAYHAGPEVVSADRIALTLLLEVATAGPNERGRSLAQRLERLRAEHASRPYVPAERAGQSPSKRQSSLPRFNPAGEVTI